MRLFRPEVSEFRRQDWMGTIHLVTPRTGWLLALLACGFMLVLVVFLWTGKYTRSEHVQGQLMPADGLVLVAAPVAGTVEALPVDEGDWVEVDQVLAELSLERDAGAVGEVGQAVAHELHQQRERLNAALDDLAPRFQRLESALHQRMSEGTERLALLQAQIETRRAQRDNARELLKRIEPVRDQGQLTALQIHQYETTALDAEAQLQQARVQLALTRQELTRIAAELDELPHQHRAERDDLERARADTLQQLARNAGQRSVRLRASRAGRVSGLNITLGQAVAQHQPLMMLAGDAELRAELWVPPSAVGRIRIGGRVAMRYHAFPYQQYGQQYGTIRHIAERAATPEEIRARSGRNVAEPAYRVLVELERQRISGPHGDSPLRTSMTLDAALMLDRRRFVELLGVMRPPASTVHAAGAGP